jgi:hypothetical protein
MASESTHLDIIVSYRFLGSDAKLAAFSAALLDVPLQPDDDALVKLAEAHGLTLQQHSVGLGGIRTDPFPGDPPDETTG